MLIELTMASQPTTTSKQAGAEKAKYKPVAVKNDDDATTASASDVASPSMF